MKWRFKAEYTEGKIEFLFVQALLKIVKRFDVRKH